ncbi:MAG: hypothetical protein ACTSPI_11035, partial [Candidatus Heimdallarchaeaceae archaeon]
RYGVGSYSLAEAEAAKEPPKPDHLTDFGCLIGKIIVPYDGGEITEVQMVTDRFFVGTKVGDHAELGNLQGGIAGEYYHLTDAQHTIAIQAATASVSGYLSTTDWNTFNDKMDNPMTTQGDIIFGGASGVPTRLPKGVANQVLTMNASATAPEWSSVSSSANTSLSNLSSVAINTSLIPGADGSVNLGTGDLRFKDVWVQTLNSGLTPGDTLKLRARDISASTYTDILVITSNDTVTADLNALVTIGGNAILYSGGDAGTPSALVGTNITGTASGLTAGAVTGFTPASGSLTLAGANALTLTTTDTTNVTLPTSGTLLANLSEDASPQLGGDLDVVTHKIVSTDNRDIALEPDGTGRVTGVYRYIEYRILDKDTAVETGTGVGGEFRVPRAMTIKNVGAYVDTASSSGTPTFDINEAGTSILSTKITIDATEKSSETAATPPVISDSAIAADAIITFDVDAAGTDTKGLVIWLEVVM